MTDVRIKRILRVNHAGEYGAIRIYGAQILVAKHLFPDIVTALEKMKADEVNHLAIFRNAMPERDTRPCYTLWVWSWGGYLLGLITALLGRNAIMACTEAVEDVVHRHINDQIEFLNGKDDLLKDIIDVIKIEELEHLNYANEHVVHTPMARMIGRIIRKATGLMIWLSTQGASGLMERDLKTTAK